MDTADLDEGVLDPEQRVGRTLRGKWHLDALIGTGGMAAVYAATHRNGRRGAVKILHEHRTCMPRIAARFRREGYIANRVGHPNAVCVLDDDTDDDGSVFLVMELLEGATLARHAEALGGILPPEIVLRTVDGVLEVLAAAHRAAIVHRDIKPENVFLTNDGHVKVLDFGIAGLAEAGVSARVTSTGEGAMGSPAFMSPEQARARWDEVDARSDLWSVAATMFTLLTGEIVHGGVTAHEVMAALMTVPPRRLATVLPGVAPELAEIVDRGLQLRSADRWPDAETMREAVRAAQVALKVPVDAASVPLVRRGTGSLPSRLELTSPSESARSARRRLTFDPGPDRTRSRRARTAAFGALGAAALAFAAAMAAGPRDHDAHGLVATPQLSSEGETSLTLPFDPPVPLLLRTLPPPAPGTAPLAAAPALGAARPLPMVAPPPPPPISLASRSVYERRF